MTVGILFLMCTSSHLNGLSICSPVWNIHDKRHYHFTSHFNHKSDNFYDKAQSFLVKYFSSLCVDLWFISTFNIELLDLFSCHLLYAFGMQFSSFYLQFFAFNATCKLHFFFQQLFFKPNVVPVSKFAKKGSRRTHKIKN